MTVEMHCYESRNGKTLARLIPREILRNKKDGIFLGQSYMGHYDIYHFLGTTCFVNEKSMRVYGNPETIKNVITLLEENMGKELIKK